jgi:glutathione peroxidase
MNVKQRFLQFVYPIFNGLNKLAGKSTKIIKSSKVANTSFYSLKAILNNGKVLDFAEFRNKKVLIVNTASDCGFTNQYEGLQALHEKYMGNLMIIGFPANDFGEQEKGADESIARFCKINYGVTFPLAQKSTVIKLPVQHPVYQWLTDEEKNGWNYVAPTWNFCKYLVDEEGNLTHFFEAAVEPMGRQMEEAIGAPAHT